MVKKPKFKPVITRIKLNPEQAVLACTCYSTGYSSKANNDGGGCSGKVLGCQNTGFTSSASS